MMKSSSARLSLLVLSIAVSRCNCDEDLQGSGLAVPQIDVCVVATPDGAPPTCFQAVMAERHAEQCASGGECLLPELTVDLGAVPAGETGQTEVVVKSVGTAALALYTPQPAPGSSGSYRLEGVTGQAGQVMASIEPGSEFVFVIKLRGNSCGEQTAKLPLVSNDAHAIGNLPVSYVPEQPDSPIVLNITGRVSGPCMCPPPESTIDFGSVPVGQTRMRRFTFTSCGDAPLLVDEAIIGVDARGVFSVAATSFTNGDLLQPGAAADIDLEYAPVFETPPSQPDAGQMWLRTNAPTMQPEYVVYLLGRATPRPMCKLQAVPVSSSFGTVDGTASRTFRIINDGLIACRLFDVQRTAGSTDFTVSAGAPPPDVTLLPTESHFVDISFTPTASTPAEAEFTVSADDVDGQVSTATLLVTGNPTVSSSCAIEVQPDFGDFGDVSIGSSATINFTITNVGNDFSLCRVESAAVSGDPDFHPGDLGIASMILFPGMPQSINVTFEPESEGQKLGTLELHTSEGTIDVPLWGNSLGAKLCVDVNGGASATLRCTPTQPCATVDYGTVAVGSEVNRSITLTNCSEGQLDVRGLVMDPSGGIAFIKTAPAASELPMHLGPNQSRTVMIKYRPNSASSGDFGGMDVLSNAVGAETARIALVGNDDGSCPRVLRCNPGALSFGTQDVGVTEVRTAVCSNFGSEPITISSVSRTGSGDIAVTSDTYAELAPGADFTVQLSCTPAASGVRTATLSITSTACDASPLNIPVDCTGRVPDLPQCIGSNTYQPLEKWRWSGASSYPENDDVWVTPVVINLNDDNSDGVVDVLDTPDVIFTALKSTMSLGAGGATETEAFCNANAPQPAVIFALSGDDGSELWHFGVLPGSDPGDPSARAFDSEANLAAGDIDADGLPEVIGVRYTWIPPPECEPTDFQCCMRGKYIYGSLYALENDGTFKWESERWHMPESILENAAGPALGDMDGDGFPEIAFGNAVYDHNGILLFEGATQSQDNPGDGEGSSGHGAFSLFADLDGDGTNELVAGNTAFDHDGRIVWRAGIDDGLPTVANLDADNRAEIVILTGFNDLYVLEGENGAVKYGPMRIPSGNVDDSGAPEGFISTNAAIGDLDGDGFPEIVVAATNLVHVYEHDLIEKWTMPISDQTGASGPTTFDFEGDGRAEVVYADEKHVFIFDGQSGAVKYEAERNSRTIVDNPVIADVDNDGHADIILAMESIAAGMHGLIVYSNKDNNWVATRRVWNQHTYHITNVSESGVVPASEGSGWVDYNVYRSNVVRCE